MLGYHPNMSVPPRHPDDVLCWVSTFAHYGTACNYLGYLKNFCETESLSVAWYDSSVLSWKRGANKYRI